MEQNTKNTETIKQNLLNEAKELLETTNGEEIETAIMLLQVLVKIDWKDKMARRKSE